MSRWTPLLVEGIADRGSPVMANRTLKLIHLIFNDGVRRGFPTLEANPAHLVEPPAEEEGRDRYLRRPEIRAVWEATEEDLKATGAKGQGAGYAFQLALLTGQRMGSIFAKNWDQIQENGNGGKVWRIPAEHFKGKRPHLVPLSPQAVAVLEEIRGSGPRKGWLFPSRRGSNKPHLQAWNNSLVRIRGRTEIPHWTAHDFRTTFRTHATRSEVEGGLGIAGPVADSVLGHVENTLGYSRYTGDQVRYLLHEKKEALRKWGQFVADAVEEPPA